MTLPDLVAKKLARIDTSLAELAAFARADEIASDLRMQRFVEHTLQIGIQAALDAASHVVSLGRLGEPRTNRELFSILARHGWLAPELATRLERMAGFRNVLVHGYDDVDLAIVRDVLEHHLDDLAAFARAVRSRVEG